MKFQFTKVSTAVLSAFNAYQRQDELITRKDLMLKDIINEHELKIESILFFGFDPWILGNWEDHDIFVAMVTHDVAKFLEERGVQYTRVFDAELETMIPVDLVVAGDEFLTYAENDEQRYLVDLMSELSNDMIVTTLRDYKNLTPQTREFSLPTAIKDGTKFSTFQEFNNYEYKVKDKWISFIYENGENTATYGPFNRLPMYFKQLAKFGYDAGATQFNVQRNEMFKSLLKKNFEHLIVIKFK